MADRIFVFGSNLAGRHGAGAALAARRLHGAVYGQGEGLQGSAYAIPTKDERIRTLPLCSIWPNVHRFIDFARSNPALEFEVTEIGCGRAGYRADQIAPAFAGAPANCHLPQAFVQIIQRTGRPEGLIVVERLPVTARIRSVREVLTETEWAALLQHLSGSSHAQCMVCGDRTWRQPRIGHDRWLFDEMRGIQLLMGVDLLCPVCHSSSEYGADTACGHEERDLARMRHICRLNGWTPPRLLAHVNQSCALRSRRSVMDWEVDIRWLEGLPVSLSSQTRETIRRLSAPCLS